MKTQKYQTLNAGDVRFLGDEVRAIVPPSNQAVVHHNDMIAEWRPINLRGHVILQSDLINAEFRRPI